METKTKTLTLTPRLTIVLAGTIMACLLIGGILGYAMSSLNTSSKIQSQDPSTLTSTTENNTYNLGENVSLPKLYEQAKSSVVVVQGTTTTEYYTIWGQPYYQYGEVQGSGFIYNSTGLIVIVTNYHVVNSATNITVTFTNGDAYTTKVIGSDPYADLAVLTSNASQDEYYPLSITNSSTLSVGDPVIAIGTPYGLAGTVTSGIVSALGRTISESTTGGYVISDCIQTTTPINPGNSGGPLLNYQGEVVGITTAIVTSSEGLGFAIPSNTILREIQSLTTNGSYTSHPALGASGTDMTYGISQAMSVNVTYGWLIAQVTSGGAADKAGLKGGTNQTQIDGTTITTGGDVITEINGTRIRNMDDLSTYLEEYTLPGQTINVTIVRNNQTLTLPVDLQARAPQST